MSTAAIPRTVPLVCRFSATVGLLVGGGHGVLSDRVRPESVASSDHGRDRYAHGVGHAEDFSVGDIDPETGLEVVEASGEDAWQLTGR